MVPQPWLTFINHPRTVSTSALRHWPPHAHVALTTSVRLYKFKSVLTPASPRGDMPYQMWYERILETDKQECLGTEECQQVIGMQFPSESSVELTYNSETECRVGHKTWPYLMHGRLVKQGHVRGQQQAISGIWFYPMRGRSYDINANHILAHREGGFPSIQPWILSLSLWV